MKKRFRLYFSLSLFSCVILSQLGGCRTEEEITLPQLPEDSRVAFSAVISDLQNVKTRSLDTLYVTTSPFNGNFYIQLDTTTETGATDTIIATYKVPSGYEGELQPIDSDNELRWHSIRGQHSFYSWTMPWYDGYNADGIVDDTFNSRLWTDLAEVNAGPISIKFNDSPEGEEYDQYKNNVIYETFIGASAGPYSYLDHGKYVELTFRHLVSKINVNMLALIKEDNSINEDAVGDITFMGMPSTAIFYPHPENGGAPYVSPPDYINQDAGLTFFINNKVGNQANGTKNEFYICPELDFSQIGFKINLNNLEYGSNGDYFGSFSDVEFVRIGEDFDSPTGGDDKILHAGEMMTLNFQLIPGVGPGVSVVIEDWSTKSQTDAVNHPYQGLYTSSELEELIDLFKQYNPKNYTEIPPELMEYFDLYGRDEDGNLIFPLYDNLVYDKLVGGNCVFAIFKKFIIDGQGHQITLATNRNATFGGTPYYNLGPVRDVYISDPAGNNSIYIDSDGYVYLFNPETQDFDKTDNRLEPLDDPYNSYDINPVTGEVIRSDFYS